MVMKWVKKNIIGDIELQRRKAECRAGRHEGDGKFCTRCGQGIEPALAMADDDEWEAEEDEESLMEERAEAINDAKEMLLQDPIIIDTETTGLRDTDQIVEIACLDANGSVLFSSLVKPTVPIEEAARRVHGIKDSELTGAPAIADITEELLRVVKERFVLSYNWRFDSRLIRQSVRGHGVPFGKAWAPFQRGTTSKHCIMLLYERFHGGGSLVSLANALEQCGITVEGRAHRALADAEAARLVLRHMAETAP